jgi:hypothetical protein
MKTGKGLGLRIEALSLFAPLCVLVLTQICEDAKKTCASLCVIASFRQTEFWFLRCTVWLLLMD